ncbi:MAG: aminomethyl-transferring glycine dehydrogenase subunit GcvPB, partial [Candidatus Omnitrophota bacterium]|jgi:glycine dehydrogenase subunit 2
MGFDSVHINLHKTFSTPHGGGGPGSGPVGVKKFLEPFLPRPLAAKTGDRYHWVTDPGQSIGRLRAFYGNSGIILRAWVYIRMMGGPGLLRASQDAVLNANYLRAKLKNIFQVAIDEPCMHEFVLTIRGAKKQGIHAGDIGKRLLDFGIHAPTVHFPLVVEEALMIEPTETEAKEVLDHFVKVMGQIGEEMIRDPDLILQAPHHLPIHRPDEVLAARKPVLSYRDLLREKMLAAEGAPVSP